MMSKGIAQILAPILCGALLLAGIVALESLLRGHFRASKRCMIAFTDIDVMPPGNLSREDFLGEVQLIAHWPDEINLLDDGLAARLHLTFAVHPWVEAVEHVKIEAGKVRVLLRYRTPVLAVPQPEEKGIAWIAMRDGKAKVAGRAVDRQGILLPSDAVDAQLPVLDGKMVSPAGRTGQPWGDAGVVRAAAVAALLAAHQEQLHLTRLEIVDGILRLNGERSRVVWGKVASEETPTEPADEIKLQRLLERCEQPGALDGREIDVRPSEKATQRPLTP